MQRRKFLKRAGLSTALITTGGVMVPMYQREALWLNFNNSYGDFPAALKVAAGKINCVTGEQWEPNLKSDPQNYLALPKQPWLDGFVVSKGTIRQFVATPVGQGATVEEQLTGKSEWNGMQLQMHPLKANIYFDQIVREKLHRSLKERATKPKPMPEFEGILNSPSMSPICSVAKFESDEMGIGAGGRMKQEIYRDEYSASDYDANVSSRCFVHFLNAEQWKSATNLPQPRTPVSVESYKRAGLPWFLHYADAPGVEATERFKNIKSVDEISEDFEKMNELDGVW